VQALGQALGYIQSASVDKSQVLGQVQAAQVNSDWPQAITLLERALDPVTALTASWPADEIVSLWNKLGYSYFMINQWSEAEAAFKRGLEHAPHQLDLLSNLADLYLQQEQFELATEYLNRALRIDPTPETAGIEEVIRQLEEIELIPA
jgi:tetratricopeptide (TPR) repeat protein